MNALKSSGSGGFSDFKPAVLFLIFAVGLTLGIVLCTFSLLPDSPESAEPQQTAQSTVGESMPTTP